MRLQKKECFIHMVEGNAFELTNGKTINLSKNVLENKRPIKFISYSKKLNLKFKKFTKILV